MSDLLGAAAGVPSVIITVFVLVIFESPSDCASFTLITVILEARLHLFRFSIILRLLSLRSPRQMGLSCYLFLRTRQTS